MKRLHMKQLMVLGLTVAVLGLVGCDGDSDGSSDSGLVGTWTWASASITAPDVPGGSITISPDLLALSGVAVTATIVIDGDGTFAVTITVPAIEGLTPGGTATANGTYTISGNRITLTATSVSSGGVTEIVETGDAITVSFTVNDTTATFSASEADLVALGAEAGTSASLSFTRS